MKATDDGPLHMEAANNDPESPGYGLVQDAILRLFISGYIVSIVSVSSGFALFPVVVEDELSKEAMKLYHDKPELQGKFGLNNAYNLDEDWYATDTIGIDKGITAMMIENYQSGMLWELFMQNEHVVRALDLLGFEPYEDDAADD